ncbi:serine/threonine protein kinase [Nostoc sp. 'Peltigera membranacea cyanobiont' 210A]|uniref:serine/threonine-protein kinase n=1 Tax=Nostoc sp. 'Peltigera membranacea cyanobiont' 210A TaxID=2014529 RepID=UPI000B950A5B|nr:serine/threonine-protein kinase [Nostoc sp. 'Peltigera membranacea cyanobiont' 210A]OYD96249.1 serine/threonine protein kinase [Nostoc sp. 'Peltigera membranacea cyanobiont' 210A]
MLYCSNSSCSNPFNPDDNKFCIKCGQTLTPLLRNRFQVIRLLGEGGFSRTYEARDADRIDEPCVIKQFVPQFEGTAALEKATELFKQEAKRLYDLGEHPQIPRLIAYFEQDKRLYLVQELIEGQNLLQELQQQGAFSEEKIKQLLTDLLPILKFIHERGVIHRDIKPENIMRRLDGKLILIDFGVSKQITKTFVGVGTTVGTPGYTPLEQMRGQVFPASDLYSLGVTCIRLLTQCLPKADGSDELYDALRGCWFWRKFLPQGRSITPDFGQVLDKLIQDYVKERYQSVDEVIKSFNPIIYPSSTSRYGKYIKTNTSTQANYRMLMQVDYNKLENLLRQQRWRDADEETMAILLKISGREIEKWLDLEYITRFHCELIRTINNLWVDNSYGKFGFTVQRLIWDSVGGKSSNSYQIWCDFGNSVGWCMNSSWKNYSDLNFTLSAPKGHLPSGIFMLYHGFGNWTSRFSCLISQLEKCNIK